MIWSNIHKSEWAQTVWSLPVSKTKVYITHSLAALRKDLHPIQRKTFFKGECKWYLSTKMICVNCDLSMLTVFLLIEYLHTDFIPAQQEQVTLKCNCQNQSQTLLNRGFWLWVWFWWCCNFLSRFGKCLIHRYIQKATVLSTLFFSVLLKFTGATDDKMTPNQ